MPRSRYALCGLLASTLLAAPAPAADPAPTCLLPAPAEVVLRAPAQEAETVLKAWELASGGVEPIGRSERQRIEHLLGKNHSAHELALIGEFRGPVNAEALQERYSWTLEPGDTLRLAARPRDTAEALFVPEFTVCLDPATYLPTRVELKDRSTSEGTSIALRTTPRVEPAAASPPLLQTVSHVTTSELGEDAELEQILNNWELATIGNTRLSVQFRKWGYDHAFLIERRGTGTLAVDIDFGTVRYEVQPANTALRPDETSHRRGPDGQAYKLEHLHSETLTAAAGEVVFEDHAGRRDVIEVPRKDANGGIDQVGFQAALRAVLVPGGDDLLPWVVPASRVELLRDCRIEVSRRTDTEVWLRIVPQNGPLRLQFKEIHVLLDEATWRPRAVRTIDAAGTVEVVHSFSDWRVGRDVPPQAIVPPPVP